MRPWLSTMILAGAAASQLGSTDCGNALRDSGFDLWCGGELCAWKVERGAVQRIPTWNEGDPGVELVGADAAIEQLSPVDSGDGTCLEFSLIANVDENADVELHVDVLGDGTIEHAERIPTSSWQPLAYKLRIKAPYAGVRFELAKTGTGHAQLANIGAKITDHCEGLTELDAGPAPLGAPCTDGSGCASGICGASDLSPPYGLWFTGVCLGCDAAHACGTGDVCGATDPVSPVRAAPIECLPAGSRELGEQCSTDGECATGHCTYDTCSTCSETAGCATGEACGPAWDLPYGVHAAWTCSPNAHLRGHGEPCATDDDCQSSACAGTTREQCDDGRTCATAADCPFGTGSAGGLQNGPCTTVGVQGGSCQ